MPDSGFQYQVYCTTERVPAMAGLEKELGVPLFRKKGRNVVLTSYGKAFEEYVTIAIAQLEDGVRFIQNMDGEEKA